MRERRQAAPPKEPFLARRGAAEPPIPRPLRHAAQAVRYRVGTVLLYRYDTWHRGSPLAPRAPPRRVLNLAIARAELRHITPWNCRLPLPAGSAPVDPRALASAASFGFCRDMYFGASDALCRMRPEERVALGVPPPGDDYWTEEMRAAVAARFPGTHGWWSRSGSK